MENSYIYFLDIAIILIVTKIFGIISRKIHFPQVVGGLLGGLIIGPAVLNLVSTSNDSLILPMAQIGVVLLMFSAGLETDIKQIKANGLPAVLVALCGVLVPLAGGFFVNHLFFGGESTDEVLKSVFLGVVLTATSVSITVETLREMGKLKGRIGATILGAAVIDDILGILMLTIVSSFSGNSSAVDHSYFGQALSNIINTFSSNAQLNAILSVVVKIVLFAVFVFIIGFILRIVFQYLDKKFNHTRRLPIFGLVLCFAMAFFSEEFFGIADIIGAFCAGVILTNTRSAEYIGRRVDITSYMLFSPIFFASVGLSLSFDGMNMTIIWFTIALLLVAFLSKLIGCGGASLMCKYPLSDSVCIGVGMISRGEVALIVAQKGMCMGLIDEKIFPALVLVVVLTTMLTPILLKIAFKKFKI